MAKFKRSAAPVAELPTASMSDIAFLLLIFFMVSTVFVKFQGLDVVLPKAESTRKIPDKRRNICSVWVDRQGRVCIDDLIVDLPQVSRVMGSKLATNPEIVTNIKVDKDARYGFVENVFEEFKRGNVLQVNLATVTER